MDWEWGIRRVCNRISDVCPWLLAGPEGCAVFLAFWWPSTQLTFWYYLLFTLPKVPVKSISKTASSLSFLQGINRRLNGPCSLVLGLLCLSLWAVRRNIPYKPSVVPEHSGDSLRELKPLISMEHIAWSVGHFIEVLGAVKVYLAPPPPAPANGPHRVIGLYTVSQEREHVPGTGCLVVI